MPNTQALTRRIKTAGNIKQITKAMEMVSASKMRRAQAQALASRPYAHKLFSTLQTIAHLTDPKAHPLLSTHETGEPVLILVSTDKSLAGSLNTNLFRATADYLSSHAISQPACIIVGQKARAFALALKFNLIAEFTRLPDPVRYQDILPLTDLITQRYLSGEFRSVHIIYMDFVSTLVQRFAQKQLLPFSLEWSEFTDSAAAALDAPLPEKVTYLFEPSGKAILNWLLPYYPELTVFQTLLESRASEHSARMVAMKNASDNASEIISDLTLAFNKQRQAKITGELLDNVTASLVAN